jgi:hypothetical protein
MTSALVVSIIIFVGTRLSVEAGFRWGRRETGRNALAPEGIGVVETSAFALLGLILAFSFAGATSRLEHKRELIVAEANAIGSGLLAGYGMAKRGDRSWLHGITNAALLALTAYTVLDLDHPRFGLINIDAAYQPLVELREAMK